MSNTETEVHPHNHLSNLLVALINRVPWHSEQQRDEMMSHARNLENAVKGEDGDKVVPPAPVVPEAGAPATPPGFDYDQLAAAIARQQSAASEQQQQAQDATAANPSFVPPSSETATDVSEHAAVADSQ